MEDLHINQLLRKHITIAWTTSTIPFLPLFFVRATVLRESVDPKMQFGLQDPLPVSPTYEKCMKYIYKGTSNDLITP